jgi:geranylgeranyl diphosphate synthase type II
MTAALRIESALETAVSWTCGPEAPPTLAAAIRAAVFPGGARVRPTLCIAVAAACGDDAPGLTDAAAAAVELMHCASLVHDDLPCFDDAALRRGRPSVHAAFGEPLAVLTGDALIVLAFETLARAGAAAPERLPSLLLTLCRGVGMPGGIIAGQGYESEIAPPVERYHQAKTGALFVAAVMSGALAAGADPAPWRRLGQSLGAAYQIADDLMDAASAPSDADDKPLGQDARLGRPSLVAELGVKGAYARLRAAVGEAAEAVPPCPGARSLRDLVEAQALRLAPKHLARSAA